MLEVDYFWNVFTKAKLCKCDQCKQDKMCTFTDNPLLHDNVNSWWCRTCWHGVFEKEEGLIS